MRNYLAGDQLPVDLECPRTALWGVTEVGKNVCGWRPREHRCINWVAGELVLLQAGQVAVRTPRPIARLERLPVPPDGAPYLPERTSQKQ